MFSSRALGLGVLIVVAPQLVAAANPSATTLRDFIFDKLEYDTEYFRNVLRLAKAGKRDSRLDAAKFEREVKRARTNVPVLGLFGREKPAYLTGQPLSLPTKNVAHRVYTNLLAILNMLQAEEAQRFEAVLVAGEFVAIEDREQWGRVRETGADYYVQLYRKYFYMMAAANFALGNDAEAVRWFARIEADSDLQSLRQSITNEAPDPKRARAVMLDRLRSQPLAVMPFENLEKKAEVAWLSRGLSEVIAADLLQYTDLFVLERGQLDKVITEMALSDLGVTSTERAAEIGQMLDAKSLVVGGYRVAGDQVEVTLRLISVEDNQALAAAQGSVPMANLFGETRGLLLQLFAKIGWLDEDSSQDLMQARAPRAETMRDLVRARSLKTTDSDQAREMYERAMRENPSYARLFDDLAADFADVTSSVAIMPFINTTQDPADDWMVRGVEDGLATDLPKMRFTVVERLHLESLIKEHVARQVVDLEAACELGGYAGADFIVMGSFMRQGLHLRIDARFVEVKTGIVNMATTVENRKGDYMGLLTSLSEELARLLNEKLSEETIASLAGKSMRQDEFEKLARQELAKDSLAESVRLDETAVVAPAREIDFLYWAAVAGVAAGSVMTVVGLAVADRHGDNAAYNYALAAVSSLPADQQRYLELRDGESTAALTAQVFGYAGLGVATLALAYLIFDQLFGEPEVGAEGSVSGPTIEATLGITTNNGIGLGLKARF